MKLIDVEALTPRHFVQRGDQAWTDWLQVLRAVWGHQLVLPEERLQTLRRLATDVWGDVEVVTHESAFLFWRLADKRVAVSSVSGKRMPAGLRTTASDYWAAGLLAGDHRKAACNTVLRRQPEQVIELQRRLDGAGRREMDLIETTGHYELVTPDNWRQVTGEVLWHLGGGGSVAMDTETAEAGEEDTHAPNPYRSALVGVSLAIRPGHAWYLPVDHRQDDHAPQPWNLSRERVLAFVEQVLDAAPRILMHHAKYDYGVLANPLQQLPVDKVYQRWLPKTEDTMLRAALLNHRAGLKPLAESRLGVTAVDFKRLTGGRPFNYVPQQAAVIYAGQDADWTLQLDAILAAEMDEWDRKPGVNLGRVYQLEKDIVELFIRMERRGIWLDRPALEAQLALEQGRAASALELIHHAAQREGIWLPEDWNPGSPQQVAQLLYTDLGLPVLNYTKTGAPGTGAKALNALGAAGVQALVLHALRSYKKYSKRASAFLEPLLTRHLQPDLRVRTSYAQVGAATGRTASRDPNLQQWYGDLRKLARQENGGEIAGIDYSQIELRVLAAIHEEPAMVQTFNLPDRLADGSPNPEADPHWQTMSRMGLAELFGPKRGRTFARNYNFGIAFGAEPPTLSETTGQPRSMTERLYNDYWLAYPEYDKSLRRMKWEHLERGYTTTWAGRLRILDTAPHKAKENHRLIANTPVQGGALDIAKHAGRELLPLIREAESQGIHPFNFVHDEFDFEWDPQGGATVEDWREFLVRVARVMEATNPFRHLLPIKTSIETGKDWGSIDEVDWADQLLEYGGEDVGDPDDLVLEIEQASARDWEQP